MNSAEYVSARLEVLKSMGDPLQVTAWKFAKLCVAWAYVFGARGEYCTPANRRARDYNSHPTIKTACKNFDGSGSCTGCKWYPSGKRTRFFDCRGFTYWVIMQVFGFKIMGAGATSQWNTESNWKAKGTIDTIPADTLVCLFVNKGSKMEHTGFGFNNETIECSNGVQWFEKRKSKWTHWAVPICVDAEIKPAEKPTLQRGSKGPYVTLLQTQLIQRGYSLPKFGADGDFGAETLAAVKAFQADNDLPQTGIVDAATWAAFDTETPKYTVEIPHLSKSLADALTRQYGGTMTQERGL